MTKQPRQPKNNTDSEKKELVDFTADALLWWDHVDAMEDLTACHSKVFRRLIRDQCGARGYCDRSQEGIARKCGCSVRTVNRALVKLQADGSIRSVSGDKRPRGRGHLPSKHFVNWEHRRWKDCPPRRFPSARAVSCSGPVRVDDQHDKSADKSISASVEVPTVAVSQKHSIDQTQTPPVDAVEVANFAEGAQGRHVQIRPEDVPFLLMLLIRANADRVHWLRWCQRYESPHKYRNPRALLTHLVRKYTVEHAPHCVDQCLRC